MLHDAQWQARLEASRHFGEHSDVIMADSLRDASCNNILESPLDKPVSKLLALLGQLTP